MVLVSVVMCCRNHEKYVAAAMDSVLNQTFKDLELLITEDCSTDNSAKIIADYQKNDPRVHALFHTKNIGVSQTLNDGLDRVSGKYVCFLDSDDLWVENKLEKQLKILGKDDTKLLWSEGEVINSQGLKTGELVTQHIHALPNKSGCLFEPLLKELVVFRQSMIFRADYVENIRFDPQLKYVNDHLFLVDLAVDHEFLFMPEILAKYRIHESNISNRNKLGWAKDKVLIRQYFLQRYGDKMSSRAKADIKYQIGFYLSRLGKNEEAKKYYLQALKIDHTHVTSTLYTALMLTTGEGFIGKFLVNSFNATTELVSNLKTGRMGSKS
ncbi:MAG: glycosyltransferase [Candidatus Bathyarchaeia archaeon]|jgi:glycosyltransferase involved in cell wall biosynthesis